MCTPVPVIPLLSTCRNLAAALLAGLKSRDYHAHSLALQRFARLCLHLTPDDYTLVHARDVVALEAGYATWAELELGAAEPVSDEAARRVALIA